MASLRARLIDRQRYAKTYSFVRVRPQLVYQTTEALAFEVGTITFVDSETGTLTFEAAFADTSYTLAAITRQTSGNANVAVYVESTTATSVTVRTSAPFTGEVDIIAVKVG